MIEAIAASMTTTHAMAAATAAPTTVTAAMAAGPQRGRGGGRRGWPTVIALTHQHCGLLHTTTTTSSSSSGGNSNSTRRISVTIAMPIVPRVLRRADVVTRVGAAAVVVAKAIKSAPTAPG